MTSLADYEIINVWCNAGKVLMRGYIETGATNYTEFLEETMDAAMNAPKTKLSPRGRRVLHDSAQKELNRMLRGSN